MVERFFLCDLDPKGAQMLEEIATKYRSAQRRITVIRGDFNRIVADVLASGSITAKTATFALLDQRTFECSWGTARQIAEFKSQLDPNVTKIEIFYFLASGWLDRSIAAVSAPATAGKLDAWWGNSDWRSLQGMNGVIRAKLVAKRFQDELGYKDVKPYAIHSQKRSGRTMYHMIHATDHPDASQLMLRAYRKISGRPDIDTSDRQLDLGALWREAEGES